MKVVIELNRKRVSFLAPDQADDWVIQHYIPILYEIVKGRRDSLVIPKDTSWDIVVEDL